MTLKIISTKEVVFEGPAGIVTLPGSMGQFTVLDRHASLISTLTAGVVSYASSPEDKNVSEMQIKGGIADIDNESNTVNLCIF